MLFCILSTKVWLELSVNKWGACQHKWQREWAGGQSPPLTIKGEKQSKEAININKVLTIIDHSALCWWAMIAMGLNTWTHMINICRSFDEAANHERFSFFFLFFLQSRQMSNATETAPQFSILQPHHSLYSRLLLPSASSEFGQSQQVLLGRARSLS